MADFNLKKAKKNHLNQLEKQQKRLHMKKEGYGVFCLGIRKQRKLQPMDLSGTFSHNEVNARRLKNVKTFWNRGFFRLAFYYEKVIKLS